MSQHSLKRTEIGVGKTAETKALNVYHKSEKERKKERKTGTQKGFSFNHASITVVPALLIFSFRCFC